jgi:hypothetical protein
MSTQEGRGHLAAPLLSWKPSPKRDTYFWFQLQPLVEPQPSQT